MLGKTIPTILVVDDETTIVEVVRLYLEREGFRVVEALDGPSAVVAIERQRPDLVVLDLMLPGLGGLDITRRLRAQGDLPIIVLTARGAEADRVLGLELGADDYIAKPFSPTELVARVKAVLRRSTGAGSVAAGERPIMIGDLTIDPRTRSVERNGEVLVLTAKEFDLLWFLARHPRQVFTRTQLLDQVWGYEYYGDASTVTVHVRRLREKLETDPSQPEHILTVWGIGYRFEQ
jgi:DNA-binding response OmpR family regulator